jgi:hypothetical protein
VLRGRGRVAGPGRVVVGPGEGAEPAGRRDSRGAAAGAAVDTGAARGYRVQPRGPGHPGPVRRPHLDLGRGPDQQRAARAAAGARRRPGGLRAVAGVRLLRSRGHPGRDGPAPAARGGRLARRGPAAPPRGVRRHGAGGDDPRRRRGRGRRRARRPAPGRDDDPAPASTCRWTASSSSPAGRRPGAAWVWRAWGSRCPTPGRSRSTSSAERWGRTARRSTASSRRGRHRPRPLHPHRDHAGAAWCSPPCRAARRGPGGRDPPGGLHRAAGLRGGPRRGRRPRRRPRRADGAPGPERDGPGVRRAARAPAPGTSARSGCGWCATGTGRCSAPPRSARTPTPGAGSWPWRSRPGSVSGCSPSTARAFPTWSEAITPPALDLAARTDGSVS